MVKPPLAGHLAAA